ncbi:3-1 [Durusdinium trenchii]|uniref:3-1 n=1 Tax=Durusdinium trenchii TaxID=1381693 RepID=A0ABP0PPT5_9DINO
MLLELLILQQLAIQAFSDESFVKADGSINVQKRHHHIHRGHEEPSELERRRELLAREAPSMSSLLAEIEAATQSEARAEVANVTSTPKPTPTRQDSKFPVISEWACALMCAGHAEDGCCTYKSNAKRVGDENDGDNHEEDTGLCEFRPGYLGVDETLAEEDWTASQCIAGYSTSKCAEWKPGKCMGKAQDLSTASKGLPIWDLAFEDHFDRLTCVPDRNGVLRPNPETWTTEIGYKRGKESQFYLPDNVECKDGALVITAKRERSKGEATCEVKGSDPDLDVEACQVCAPPTLEYNAPCDRVAGDGWPVCDCSLGAEYTSGSLVSRHKQEFSYGLLEVRAKIDTRPGLWPALWAVGDFDKVPWPKNGEIDILDAFQGMLKASVIHAGESGGAEDAVFHGSARRINAEWERSFHTWALEWDEEFISIRVDRQELLRLDLTVADPVRTSWPNPFKSGKKFFMILNLAVGGQSGGNATQSDFPATLLVDYVKYFKKKGRTSR